MGHVSSMFMFVGMFIKAGRVGRNLGWQKNKKERPFLNVKFYTAFVQKREISN